MKQTVLICLVALGSLAGCTIKHQVVPSKEPMTFNINVNIDQVIRVRLDKDVEDLIANNPDLF
ncbi:YnbE family lipoprotein [Litorimonas cladophorae]|uniref:YnbE family lipoprotein n=1 Tax=Litorimonas cladophorae TaxID=1220491 RepID=A0A918NGH4_9PROT|nr:YnbE family lipoprotein [Litorimonas cladophorae]GGX65743.1 YnbE family lipoprotein [Litorimonas cladophorae]